MCMSIVCVLVHLLLLTAWTCFYSYCRQSAMMLCLYRPIPHFIFLKKGLLDGQWSLCICWRLGGGYFFAGPVCAVIIYIMVKHSTDEWRYCLGSCEIMQLCLFNNAVRVNFNLKVWESRDWIGGTYTQQCELDIGYCLGDIVKAKQKRAKLGNTWVISSRSLLKQVTSAV